MEAVILVGLQGAGQSSFYRERFFATHVRISLDLLKTRHRERRLLQACVETGQRFVVDNTNPTRAERAGLHPGRQGGRVPGRRLLLPLPSRGLHAAERAAARGPAGAVEGPPRDGGPDGTPRRGTKGSTNCTTSGSTRPAASWSRGGGMKLDELDGRMRAFEAALDPCVLPGVYMVARLDGRQFHPADQGGPPVRGPLRPPVPRHDAPDRRAPDDGLRAQGAYGYTQSDEISLLFGPDEDGFGRKLRKLLSVLSGEASTGSRCSWVRWPCSTAGSRSCPRSEHVVDYFRWRDEDAHRNALNAHCYWLLRKQGRAAGEADEELRGLSVSAKNELLFRHGINFNDLPPWQKRGSGLYWEEYERPGSNPLTGERVVARRRRIRHDLDLPVRTPTRRSSGICWHEASSRFPAAGHPAWRANPPGGYDVCHDNQGKNPHPAIGPGG